MKNERLPLRRVDILLLMMRDEFPSQLCFQRVSGSSFTAQGGRAPLPSISRAYSRRMVALPDQNACTECRRPSQGRSHQGIGATLEAHLWSSHHPDLPEPAEQCFTSVPLFLSLLCHFSNKAVTCERAALLSCWQPCETMFGAGASAAPFVDTKLLQRFHPSVLLSHVHYVS